MISAVFCNRGVMMSLLDRIRGFETIERLERAMNSRLREGGYLAESDHGFWAIYTLGYVVELCLKVSYYRLRRFHPRFDDVGPERVKAKAWARQLGAASPARNDHDLVFWMKLVIKQREFVSEPLPAVVSSQFVARVQQVAKHWREDLRYAPSLFVRDEAQEVGNAVRWIVDHQRFLWS